jgi:hypothetical protein
MCEAARALHTVPPFSLFARLNESGPAPTEWFDSVAADWCPSWCQIMPAR